MTGLKFVAIVSSVREGRLAERIMKLVQKTFDEKLKPNGHTLKFVDPKDFDLPVLKQAIHWYPDQSKAPEVLHRLNAITKEADAYLILTAEYNRTMPSGLTNTMDHIAPANFEYKPSGIISYSMGPQGGCFAVAAARPFLSEMGCLPVKHFVAIGTAHKEVTEEGTTENSHIVSSLGKLFAQVEWWGVAAKERRELKGTPS